ncbi:hypothetical protein [Haloglycomyces albus]|uniref:hypothetical protein n=1 Tax=Haloglycomyces albus TaxID=526067 RepID=UPI00046D2A00|nr:hypothetical protein [Haloglycomyces albus]
MITFPWLPHPIELFQRSLNAHASIDIYYGAGRSISPIWTNIPVDGTLNVDAAQTVTRRFTGTVYCGGIVSSDDLAEVLQHGAEVVLYAHLYPELPTHERTIQLQSLIVESLRYRPRHNTIDVELADYMLRQVSAPLESPPPIVTSQADDGHHYAAIAPNVEPLIRTGSLPLWSERPTRFDGVTADDYATAEAVSWPQVSTTVHQAVQAWLSQHNWRLYYDADNHPVIGRDVRAMALDRINNPDMVIPGALVDVDDIEITPYDLPNAIQAWGIHDSRIRTAIRHSDATATGDYRGHLIRRVEYNLDNLTDDEASQALTQYADDVHAATGVGRHTLTVTGLPHWGVQLGDVVHLAGATTAPYMVSRLALPIGRAGSASYTLASLSNVRYIEEVP